MGVEALDSKLAIIGSSIALAFVVVIAIVIAVSMNGSDDSREQNGTEPDNAIGASEDRHRLSEQSLDVSPSTVLFTSIGDSRKLSAALPDGSPASDVIWRSSNPTSVSISDDGVIEAVVAIGSALITAETDRRLSAPVLVYIAEPVEGAVLIEDEQVVAPAVDNPGARNRTYTARFRNLNLPTKGTLLIGTGEAPIGGRVVEASKDGNSIDVVLEVVPPEEMFQSIFIDQEIDLSNAEITIPESLLDDYEVEQLADGTYQFTPLEPAVGSLPPGQHHISYAGQSQTLYLLGPFECETTLPRLPIALSQPASFNLNANLSISLLVRNQLEHLILNGQPRATLNINPVVNVEFSGKLECKLELLEATIPVGGALAVLFGGQVPMGLGMEVEGKLTLARLGAEISVQVGANFRIGVDCAGGQTCSMVNELDPTADGSMKWVIPNPEQQFRVEPSAYAFAFAELELGSKLTKRFRFDALELKVGLAQDANLAPVSVQVADSGYSSNYQLKLKAEAEAAQGLDDWLEFLKLRTLKLKVEIDQVLQQSPTGTASASTDEFETDDTVSFKVSLNPNDLYYAIVGYNVEEVRVYRRTGGEIQQIASTVPGNGVESVTLQWTADSDGLIGQDFYAFALTKLLPVPSLELGPVLSGDRATPTPRAGLLPTPVDIGCPLTKRQVLNEDGSISHEYFSYPEGLGLSMVFTETDSEKGLIRQQTVTATMVWDEILQTRVGPLLYNSAWRIHQTISALDGDEMTTYSDDRTAATLSGVPLLGTMNSWEPGELALGVRREQSGKDGKTSVRVFNYMGCSFWDQ